MIKRFVNSDFVCCFFLWENILKPLDNLHACIYYMLQEVRAIKNITLRVSDDFHYSVKTYSARCGLSLQGYMIDTIEKDLLSKDAFVKSPEAITEFFDDLSEDELLEVIKRVKEEKQNRQNKK